MNLRGSAAKSLAVIVPTTLTILGLATMGATSQTTGKGKSFAQELVESIHAMHPEAVEIGISARSASGCHTLASTDPGDIGEKCERDDLEPMRTGKPLMSKGKDGFDVSLPLHDTGGKLLGAVGIEFRLEPGQNEAGILPQATKIVSEMEAQIPSRAKLYERLR